MSDFTIAAGNAENAASNCPSQPDHHGSPSQHSQDPPGLPLELRHLRQLSNAEKFAAAQGWPLCAHVTIHLRLAEGFQPESWPAFQSELFDKMARWVKRQGLPVAFIWTRECGPSKGPHVHLALALPKDRWPAFKRYMLRAGRFEISDAGGEAIVITGGRFGMFCAPMRAGVLRYIVKSLECSATTRAALGLRHKPTEPVLVQRCGASHSISQQARRKAGWTEIRSIPELHAHLNPASAANDNAEAADVAA